MNNVSIIEIRDFLKNCSLFLHMPSAIYGQPLSPRRSDALSRIFCSAEWWENTYDI